MSEREVDPEGLNPCISTDQKTHTVLGVWVVHLTQEDMVRNLPVEGRLMVTLSEIYAANVLVLLHREKETGKYVAPARLRLQVDDIIGPESKDRRITFELKLPEELESDLEAYDFVTATLQRAHPGVEVHHRLVFDNDVEAAMRSMPGMHVQSYQIKPGEN